MPETSLYSYREDFGIYWYIIAEFCVFNSKKYLVKYLIDTYGK